MLFLLKFFVLNNQRSVNEQLCSKTCQSLWLRDCKIVLQYVTGSRQYFLGHGPAGKITFLELFII